MVWVWVVAGVAWVAGCCGLLDFRVLTLLLSGDGFGSCVGFGVKWWVLRVCVLAWLDCEWDMLDCDLILVVVGAYC